MKLEDYKLAQLLAAVTVTCCKNLVTVALNFLNKPHYLPRDPRTIMCRRSVTLSCIVLRFLQNSGGLDLENLYITLGPSIYVDAPQRGRHTGNGTQQIQVHFSNFAYP